MDISIVIVNYNVRHFLRQCLLSLQSANKDDISTEIWVVDNNSVDGSTAMLTESFPEVNLIANKDNVGFAKANNQAIRQCKGKYILLLNPDTLVQEDTLTEVYQFMEMHTNTGALGVKMIDGAGKFLPESKRGLPTAWNAFAKLSGLSGLFPNSRLFNRYHLGYLDENETAEIDVLCGAFMFLRKEALDKAGLLDEAFFMYGEDIDLSYRIRKSGYKIYYFPKTRIIHYKGESTKKNSLNYVRTFYQAMIIYVRKHYKGTSANVFVFLLHIAIYLRAFLSIVRRFLEVVIRPLIDFSLFTIALYLIKEWWARFYFEDAAYFSGSGIDMYLPVYALIWVICLGLTASYKKTARLRHHIWGMGLGAAIVLVGYALLDNQYRTSRAVIVMGFLASAFILMISRSLWNKYAFRRFGTKNKKKMLIISAKESSLKIQSLLDRAHVNAEVLGTISPSVSKDPFFLNDMGAVKEVSETLKVDEIIFSSEDVSMKEIMETMTKLGPKIAYKIGGDERLGILGSHSKNTTGEFYGVEISYNIDQPDNKLTKRIFDILFASLILMLSPIIFLLNKGKIGIFKNIFNVLTGKNSWVGYNNSINVDNLPKIKKGILSIHKAASSEMTDTEKEHLNFHYAKNYTVWMDVELVIKNLNQLA